MDRRQEQALAIGDGRWHWCPGPSTDMPLDGINEISIVIPSTDDPGSVPASNYLRLFAQFIPRETDDSSELLNPELNGIRMAQGVINLSGLTIEGVILVRRPSANTELVRPGDPGWFACALPELPE